jgi:hypothetical protein
MALAWLVIIAINNDRADADADAGEAAGAEAEVGTQTKFVVLMNPWDPAYFCNIPAKLLPHAR